MLIVRFLPRLPVGCTAQQLIRTSTRHAAAAAVVGDNDDDADEEEGHAPDEDEVPDEEGDDDDDKTQFRLLCCTALGPSPSSSSPSSTSGRPCRPSTPRGSGRGSGGCGTRRRAGRLHERSSETGGEHLVNL